MSENTPDLQAALQHGDLELKGQFMLGSNYTFLVKVLYQGAELQAVYKPQRGERPLWDFPESSLAGREVAAYLVSQALGWDFVPLTVLRQDGPYGPGSVQQYVPYDPEYHYFSFSPVDRQRLRPVVLFDLLVNNADRKGSHVLVDTQTNRLWLIDHGLCFHALDKLRTVIWDFAGESIPSELLVALEGLRSQLSGPDGLPGALGAYLNPEELAALDARADQLLASGTFPHPPEDRRAYPWPPL
jgi:uncharacterized repeat protein (TIGR03843 family)